MRRSDWASQLIEAELARGSIYCPMVLPLGLQSRTQIIGTGTMANLLAWPVHRDYDRDHDPCRPMCRFRIDLRIETGSRRWRCSLCRLFVPSLRVRDRFILRETTRIIVRPTSNDNVPSIPFIRRFYNQSRFKLKDLSMCDLSRL